MEKEQRLIDANEQCRKCFHFQVCASVLKNELYIREVLFGEKAPKCKEFVEVVRCKNCTYAMPDGYVCFGNGEMMPPHPTYPDRHCSCGERRTDHG